MKQLEIPMEHPRPSWLRAQWESLDGLWQFAFDDDDRGLSEHWEAKALPGVIRVPYCYQSRSSMIGDPAYHPLVWYRRTLSYRESWQGQRVLLHFEGVDERFDLWVNAVHIGSHRGGSARATFDLTRWLCAGENALCLRVEDAWDWSKSQGKQAPVAVIDRCWYTQTTGIWKSVWLEIVPELYLESGRITPDIDRRQVTLELELNRDAPGAKLHLEISYHGQTICRRTRTLRQRRVVEPVSIEAPDFVDEVHDWTPERPELFDLILTVESAQGTLDTVQTYFAMRKIEARHGQVYLNNRPYYLRMVLDQGYWPDSLMTPPGGESLRADVLLAKSFGFNGVRKHQKLEDERYYYWADRLGLLVWAEMPSSYAFRPQGVPAFLAEWMAMVQQLYNHPSIMAWVPFNESWGIRDVWSDPMEQHFAEAGYHIAKALDGTRLVSTNDGWEQVTSDLCAIHDYYEDGAAFEQKFSNLERLLETDAQGRALYAAGYRHAGQPVLLTEFGGIACGPLQQGAWGYNRAAESGEALLERIRAIIAPVLAHRQIAGYCYTQLTDVMQEINGLADASHTPKLDPGQVCRVFGPSGCE